MSSVFPMLDFNVFRGRMSFKIYIYIYTYNKNIIPCDEFSIPFSSLEGG